MKPAFDVECARRFESWERSCAAQAAFGRAIDYALEWGLDAIGERGATLADALRRQLDEIDGVTVMDRGRELCGIVTLSSERVSAAALQRDLAVHGIRTTTVGFSAKPLPLATARSPLLLRASPHYHNTLDEAERCVAVLRELLRD
jgi:selenocysteine lyase/cysteine desulfurase